MAVTVIIITVSSIVQIQRSMDFLDQWYMQVFFVISTQLIEGGGGEEGGGSVVLNTNCRA